MLELTHMISRIDLQNDIAYFKLKNGGIHLPRIANRNEKLPVFSLPFDEEIKDSIQSQMRKRKLLMMLVDLE